MSEVLRAPVWYEVYEITCVVAGHEIGQGYCTFLPRYQATVPTIIGNTSSLFFTRISPACDEINRMKIE